MTLSDSHMNDVERENELVTLKNEHAEDRHNDATSKQKDVTDRLDTHDVKDSDHSGVDR